MYVYVLGMYIYRMAHTALRCLPTKQTVGIGENLQDELRGQDKADQGELEPNSTYPLQQKFFEFHSTQNLHAHLCNFMKTSWTTSCRIMLVDVLAKWAEIDQPACRLPI
jgi:hypothetical protein